MGWIEVRELVSDTLPEFMNKEGGWPTPEDVDFWEIIFELEEIRPFVRDQMIKYAALYPDIREALGSAYKYIAIPAEAVSGEDYFKKKQLEIFSDWGVELLLSGPLQDYFLDKLEITQESSENILVLLDREKRKLVNLSKSEKAILWWTVWGNIEDKTDINRLVTLGIKPPEII